MISPISNSIKSARISFVGRIANIRHNKITFIDAARRANLLIYNKIYCNTARDKKPEEPVWHAVKCSVHLTKIACQVSSCERLGLWQVHASLASKLLKNCFSFKLVCLSFSLIKLLPYKQVTIMSKRPDLLASLRINILILYI